MAELSRDMVPVAEDPEPSGVKLPVKPGATRTSAKPGRGEPVGPPAQDLYEAGIRVSKSSSAVILTDTNIDPAAKNFVVHFASPQRDGWGLTQHLEQMRAGSSETVHIVYQPKLPQEASLREVHLDLAVAQGLAYAQSDLATNLGHALSQIPAQLSLDSAEEKLANQRRFQIDLLVESAASFLNETRNSTGGVVTVTSDEGSAMFAKTAAEYANSRPHRGELPTITVDGSVTRQIAHAEQRERAAREARAAAVTAGRRVVVGAAGVTAVVGGAAAIRRHRGKNTKK